MRLSCEFGNEAELWVWQWGWVARLAMRLSCEFGNEAELRGWQWGWVARLAMRLNCEFEIEFTRIRLNFFGIRYKRIFLSRFSSYFYLYTLFTIYAKCLRFRTKTWWVQFSSLGSFQKILPNNRFGAGGLGNHRSAPEILNNCPRYNHNSLWTIPYSISQFPLDWPRFFPVFLHFRYLILQMHQ